MLRISYNELKDAYVNALIKRDMEQNSAKLLATTFVDMAWDGIYSHGIYRFPVFIKQVDQGMVKLNSRPTCVRQLAALEQWDCQLGPGPLNGMICSEQAMKLSDQYGVGVVAMRNSNHWMRGGAYALKVARLGYACIAITNSSAVMPAWGAKDMRLGTNPLIIGIPGDPPALLDMSCSQYSYGALEVAKVSGRSLPVDGGYDTAGNLSRDPGAVAQAKRLLPAGYWKGSALAIVLDMLVSFLADGNTTVELTEDIGAETAISQMFIVFDLKRTITAETMQGKLKRMLDYILASQTIDDNTRIQIPGHSVERLIKDHETNGGMPIHQSSWQVIQNL